MHSSRVIALLGALLIACLGARSAGADPSIAKSVAQAPARVVSISAAVLTETAKFQPSGFAPGFSLGVELPWLVRSRHTLFQTLAVGYFHHTDVEQAILAGTELAYRYTFGFGLYLEARLGANYLHALPIGHAYAREDGHYYSVDDRGTPRFLASVAGGLGYDLSRLSHPAPFAIFLRYQLGVETPGFEGTPVYPDTQILAGISVPLARL